MRRLWLASGSPRRLELLASVGVPVQRLRPPDLDESLHVGEMPQDYVSRLALAKALAGWQQLTPEQQAEAAVLGADTTVVLDNDVLGKPATAVDARQMLRQLSGREHRVLSAVSLVTAAFTDTRLSSSLVVMSVAMEFRVQRLYLSSRSVAVTAEWWGCRFGRQGSCLFGRECLSGRQASK